MQDLCSSHYFMASMSTHHGIIYAVVIHLPYLLNASYPIFSNVICP